MGLNHFDNKGNAVMVDVSDKDITERIATAEGKIKMNNTAMEAVVNGTSKKGDVLNVARVAGIMAAKKTFEIIPMCHLLMLTKCSVDFEVKKNYVVAKCTVKTKGKTGVEMEALTGVNVALLTIYDMLKAVDRSMEITDIKLLYKNGGKSGEYKVMIICNGVSYSSLTECLEIQKGITSFVGGGGKSTIIKKISEEIKNSVIVTTTTHIYAPKLYYNSVDDAKNAIKSEHIITVGNNCGNNKLEMAIEPYVLESIADFILVEADGSRRLPLKVPATNEPVIPRGNKKTVLICGIDALNNRIIDICHRAEETAKFLNKDIYEKVDIIDIAKILNFAYSNIDCAVINKVDNDIDYNNALKISEYVNKKLVICGGLNI